MFDNIAADDARLDDVVGFVREHLASADEKFVRRLYVAFRAWTWKALNSRRRDGELRGWYELLRRVASYVRSHHAAYADRLIVLYELVNESISVSDRLSPDEVATRDHVKELLTLLAARHYGEMERAELLRRLPIKQANLTRVLNMVEASGVIERKRTGKRSVIRLTVEGISACDRLGIRRHSETDAVRAAIKEPDLSVLPLIYQGFPEDVAVLHVDPSSIPGPSGHWHPREFSTCYDVLSAAMPTPGHGSDGGRLHFTASANMTVAYAVKAGAKPSFVRSERKPRTSVPAAGAKELQRA